MTQAARSEAPGASKQAIQKHYDVGNEFYRIWLDPSLTYSAAFWEDGDDSDDLHAAQVRKLDYHARQARAAGAARVLDVGCGWGSNLRNLAERRGVGKAVGLTLSQEQANHIRSFGLPQLEVRLESWAEHTPEAPYDAIISIGAFEHFAKWGAAREEKVRGYRDFFSRCHSWLRPGGYMSLQTIAYGAVASQETIRSLPASKFLGQVIFPESDIPGFTDIFDAAEGIFEVMALRNDRLHYARTSRKWLENLRADKQRALDLVGAEVVARYERYLEMWARSFEFGTQALLRITLRRVDPFKR